MVSAAAGRGERELRALIVAPAQCSVGDGKMGAAFCRDAAHIREIAATAPSQQATQGSQATEKH